MNDTPGRPSESVWDYPRPPRLERDAGPVRVEFGGVVIVDTVNAVRILESSHPPVYYVPLGEVRPGALEPERRKTFCEWKGTAVYWNVVAGGRRAPEAAWSYPEPSPRYPELRNLVAFYPERMDACFVGDDPVRSQPGDFYGGWVNSWIQGPFKGGPGTAGW